MSVKHRNGRHCHSSVTDERTETLINYPPSESAEDMREQVSVSPRYCHLPGLSEHSSKGFGFKEYLNMSITGYLEGIEPQNLATTHIHQDSSASVQVNQQDTF